VNLQRLLGPDKRTALMRKNIFFSFLIKGWSGLVTLLLVPLTLHCLGDYKNGIWLTISSMLIWIDNLDIGLGNGLRNKLATYLAQEDMKKARETVSSTFFMLALIILPVMLAAIAAVKTFDLHAFLNVDPAVIPNLGDIMAVSILFVSATFIFKFIGNFYLGLQLPAVNNLLVTVGHTLQLVGTWLVYMGGSGSLLLIAVVNTAAPLLTYLIAYPITFYGRYPKLRPSFGTFNRHAVRSLFTIGVKFFVLQIAGILLFMSSNILISKLFDPSMVTPYQIAYRYFSITMLVFTIISAPYWSATTDAYARGDIAWIRQARRRMDKIVMGVAVVLAVMVAVSRPVYALWVGTEVEIPLPLSILMAVYLLVILASLSYSYYLNGIGALQLQLILTVTAAIVFIPLTYLMVHYRHDITSVLIVMILVNVPGLIVNKIQLHRLTHGKATGIWIK